MEIKFEKIDNVYVAEFEITSNCNIHIEREDLWMFTIESRGSKSGKYVPMQNGHYGDKYVIDVDMLGNIYPKYIKITSTSMPTYAEVNFAEQGGGSGGIDPNDPESEFFIEYFGDGSFISRPENQYFLYGVHEVKYIDPTDGNIEILPLVMALYDNKIGEAMQISFMPNKKSYINGVEATVKDFIIANRLLETYNSLPRITKEEFYNLEA